MLLDILIAKIGHDFFVIKPNYVVFCPIVGGSRFSRQTSTGTCSTTLHPLVSYEGLGF